MIGPISFKCSQIFNPVKMIHHPQKKLVKSWNYNWISRIFLLALPFFERSLFFLIRLYIRWNTIVYTMLSSSRRMQLKKKKLHRSALSIDHLGHTILKKTPLFFWSAIKLWIFSNTNCWRGGEMDNKLNHLIFGLKSLKLSNTNNKIKHLNLIHES